MKKNVFLISIFIVILLTSCIYFQYINQPSIALPNEIFTVSIAVTTEGGENEPYFGVCLPIGWTIPGDSIQCSGEYSSVIYYDDSLSTEQENASPTTDKYYWWVGKGVADTGAVGMVYADLQIQTDSQVGLFSIDYMLGNSYYGVNHQRSNDHPIQIAESAIITSVVPDQGYQNFTIDLSINGFNTHFSDGLGTENVWLSQNGNEIYANSFVVYSNTLLTANFYIPLNASFGLYDVNVATSIDSIITRADGFEILPPPPLIFVSPDSLEIVLEPGTTGTDMITINNTGGSDLFFNIIGPNCAVQFDGVDGYIQIPAISPITNVPLNQFTFEGWIYFNELTGSTQQFMEGHTENSEIFFETNGNDNCMMFHFADDGGGFATVTTNPLSLSNWHHIAGTYDGIEQRIYLNGISENVITRNTTFTITTGFTMGKDYEGNIQYLNGVIDEVRIWNVARTQEEIQSSMYKELFGTEQGLVGYWKFNEGIGDTAFDKSPYGNNGILQGGVSWSDSSAPIFSLPDWLNLTPGSGTCVPNSAIDLPVTFDATELDTGDYYFNLRILSNDPFHPEVIIPVHMLVSNVVGIRDELTLPTEFNLEQNYPNPFNPSTTIKYGIPERTFVELRIYDILGREVEVLVNEEKEAGYYKVNYDAAKLASGIYIYRLQAGSFVETKKMVLMK